MPKKAKAPHQADTKGKGWIGLPKVVAMSHAYRTLSYPARATLIEIMFYFNGHNNGKIGISQRQIMDALGTSSPHTVIDAISLDALGCHPDLSYIGRHLAVPCRRDTKASEKEPQSSSCGLSRKSPLLPLYPET
jgi:hypothetical protein